MPVLDNSVQKYIEESLMRDNAEREALHEPSGLLSASMLYQPLRYQILKAIGVPRKQIDAYTLGKFKRGRDVEDWYVGQLKNMGVLLDAQRKIMYRGAIGFADAIVDSDKMLFKQGAMPHEVKSVTNAKLKRIVATGVDWHYKMQGCFYALGEGRSHYSIDIVSAEDYRPRTYIFDVAELKNDVNKAIDNYDKALELWKTERKLPKFEANPRVMWTANLAYSMFAEEWAVNSDDWAVKQIEALGLLK
jgi:hypothetical protein